MNKIYNQLRKAFSCFFLMTLLVSSDITHGL